MGRQGTMDEHARDEPTASSLLHAQVDAADVAWHRLMAEAFVRLWWSDGEAVTVEFTCTAGDQVPGRLLELVQAQRRRSRVLRWHVRRIGPKVRLRVTGPGAAAMVAALMY